MKENTVPLRMRTKGHFDPETPFQVELDIMKEKAELGEDWMKASGVW